MPDRPGLCKAAKLDYVIGCGVEEKIARGNLSAGAAS
jgi:hypothetical protein